MGLIPLHQPQQPGTHSNIVAAVHAPGMTPMARYVQPAPKTVAQLEAEAVPEVTIRPIKRRARSKAGTS